MLSDTDTYTLVKKDPTRILINNLRRLLKDWKNNNYISERLYRSLNCSDGILSRAYGLSKIYKPNCLLRIIVFLKNILYYLTKYLYDTIYDSITKADCLIAFNQLTNLKVCILKIITIQSLDIIALIYQHIVGISNSMVKKWSYIEKRCDIPRNYFLLAVRFVLNSTYFSFNGLYYQ